MKLISRACAQWIGTWLVLFLPWILLVLHLSSFWSVDPQYSYGYVVPFWNAGRTLTQSARIHRPENCLQGSGAILRKELNPTTVEIGGMPLAFRTYLFDWNGTTLHVFYLILGGW